MKKLLLVATTLLLVSTNSNADIGGFMSGNGCYNGNFITGKVCETVERSHSFNNLDVKAYVTGEYVSSGGPNGMTVVKAVAYFDLFDHENTFFHEAGLPVIIRGIMDEGRTHKVESKPIILERDFGTTKLYGKVEFHLVSYFGARHASKLDKVEILIPGYQGILTIDL